MGEPMAHSPGGLPIYKKSSYDAACKKDRGEPEPDPPIPGVPNVYWRWELYDYAVVGYGTETNEYNTDKYFDRGDKVVFNDPPGSISYLTTEEFDTWKDLDDYAKTYDYVLANLRRPYWSALPNKTSGEGRITVTIGVHNAFNPEPFWTRSFSAYTDREEFLLIPINGSGRNGEHGFTISGWVAFVRIHS